MINYQKGWRKLFYSLHVCWYTFYHILPKFFTCSGGGVVCVWWWGGWRGVASSLQNWVILLDYTLNGAKWASSYMYFQSKSCTQCLNWNKPGHHIIYIYARYLSYAKALKYSLPSPSPNIFWNGLALHPTVLLLHRPQRSSTSSLLHYPHTIGILWWLHLTFTLSF